MYVVYAEAEGVTPVSYETWLMSIRGEKGEKGDDGLTPYIGENGNWWIGDIDTNIDNNDTNADYSDDGATRIAFLENEVTVKGLGAAAQGSTVKIGIEGTYIFSGSSNDGYIIVNSNKADIKIVLEGLSISNNDGPAIIIKNAKKVTITLAKGTVNSLSDGSSYQLTEGNANVDGAIFSKSELVINGEGSLTVNSNNAHGIVSKKGLTITGGDISVKSKGSGICGKDYLKIANSNVTVNAGADKPLVFSHEHFKRRIVSVLCPESI
jgi:hypothetical protein